MRLQVRPVRHVALFIVTDAGIDQNTTLAGVYNQGMDTHGQIALLIHKMRLHPSEG